MFRSPALVCTRCLAQRSSTITSRGLVHRIKQTAPVTQPSRSIRSQASITRTWQQFRPALPPNPKDLPKASPAKHYRKTRKWLRRLFYISATGSALYLLDKQFYASALARTFRSFALGFVVAVDYKINFRAHPYFYNSVEELHAKSAERLFELLHSNGGLYLKIGQAIAMQSAILPPQFQKMFSRMFDDAPQNEWKDVERVIREDFGKSPEELFAVIEKKARASASVAQVHWAQLHDGREVAVKVQKREIASQVGWDLWSFKALARIYTWWFDLPFYSLVPYITDRLMLETDFENEASNGEKMRDLVQAEPRLRSRVYIPAVFREFTSARVLTAEWIEGVRLWDKQGVEKPWYGGWRTGSPGCGGTPLDDSSAAQPRARKDDGLSIKPERNHWKGRTGTGGLGLSMQDVMGTMVDLFSAQMFLWGWVHCDPHPGNIFVRRQPNGRAQLVLIDHGLYIRMSPRFRHEYSLFWKSLIALDNATLGEVARGWGINSPDLFASATLMRPYTGGANETSDAIKKLSEMDEAQRSFEAQNRMRQGVRDILGDGSKFPQELIFIGRNLRIVQGNNQFLGSPVNRVKITGMWASRALVEDENLPWRERLANYARHLVFRTVLLGSDVFFYFSKLKQVLGLGKGMEDDIEGHMRQMAKGFGVELNHSVFEG